MIIRVDDRPIAGYLRYLDVRQWENGCQAARAQ